jgi:enoyl-CoA hydratase/carnithine racemase
VLDHFHVSYRHGATRVASYCDAYNTPVGYDHAAIQEPACVSGLARPYLLVHNREPRRGKSDVQRLVDLEIPIIAAVNGPAPVHSEYALLADVVIASDTTVFSDVPHLAFGIAPGDGLFVVWEEVLGLNRARHLEITQGSFTAQEALSWGAVAEVAPIGQVLPRAQELAEQMTQRPHLTNKYIAVIFRQRISRRLAEGTLTGMALESLTAANLAYLQQG